MAHHISFKHAWDGIKYAFSTQPNFRVHTLIAAAVLAAGIFLHLSSFEWLVLLFTITLVLVAEMINTSLESMTDLLGRQITPEAKVTKDVAAGMVLIAAVMSVIVGLVIFIPHLWPSY